MQYCTKIIYKKKSRADRAFRTRPLPDSRAWRPGEAGGRLCDVLVVGLQAPPWMWESQCTC